MADNMAWTNLGFKIFEETFGESELIRKKEEADKHLPPAAFSQKVLLGVKSFATKTYKSRDSGTGIGASGLATVVSDPKFPKHHLFTPGRCFTVQLRHGNFKESDDASMDVRTAALKFGEDGASCLLDLVFHTGEESPFWSIDSFEGTMDALHGGPIAYKEYIQSDPWRHFVAVSSSRRAPVSFIDQRYYSWLVYEFKAVDGVKRYAKFRLIPADNRSETGLPTESDQRNIWDKTRRVEEARPNKYLHEEFLNQLSKGSVKYKLQIQLHEASSDQSHLVLHPARAWNRQDYPWVDLADVTITTALPVEVTQRYWEKLVYSHAFLQAFTKPSTIHDYALSDRALRHTLGNLDGTVKPGAEHLPATRKYCIQVETGKRYGSGTNANIFITIIGKKGRTDSIKLDKFLYDDFEAESTNQYEVEGPDVGDLIMIKLHNDQGGWFSKYSDWFVARVHISTENPVKVYQFPCYRWVVTDLTLFEGEALPGSTAQHDAIKHQRRLEIEHHQKLYQWGDDPAYSVDLPGFIRATDNLSLPKDVQFTDEASSKLHSARQRAALNILFGALFNLFNKWDEFDDYRKVFTSFVGTPPPAADHWQCDVWYGSQYLNSCNPDTIRRCTELPTNFPVTQELVGNLLDSDMTLETAIKAGSVYMVDYKILEDIPQYGENNPKLERRYTSASMGLFYVRKNGDLVPIAIQLHQEPSETNPIWTPNDSKYDWLYAKLWLRNADSQWHQFITHLMRTHLFMEPINVASWRQLSTCHPVWKVLFPHMRGIFAINTLGRGRLIAEGGVADVTLSLGGGGHVAVMQKYYRGVTWDSYDVPKVLKERGVDDPQKLPRFYYRDDALLLWDAISAFVKGIIFVYYASNEDVIKDEEIQNWAKDLSHNGYRPGGDGIDKKTPESFATRESLIHFLTMIIFNASCQHAAVNFSQMDAFGFAPNSPSLLRRPPPTKKGEITLQEIMNSLPTRRQTAFVLATVYDLTRIYPTEKFLGDYSESLFTDVKANEVISRFQEKLREISKVIKRRNDGLKVPYPYLLPERVPNSIAI